VYPLYSSLPPHQQRLIFRPAPGPRVPGGPPGRKVVVGTLLECAFWKHITE
jgi:pre-mRNA-splicing factor ATP-dependent RNA helicase DHX15/PRP43